ncbi:Putative effector of murein hydrolase LrgA [Kluyvera cryocrescens]|uniref:Effector of murein hydrolase LrgA n=1 Tax=Kluyvera cryocrescens TaxID=580 RepID=A0A485C9K7_KLUCR|nr:Putative effector of murein hydrolase LrgA [Kluyvera cryocrescens]
MLILFILLGLQILPAKWVNPGCYVLIRYMALLFVPIGVRRDAVLLAIKRPVWPGCSVLYHQYSRGVGGGELEFTSGSR